MHQSFLVGFDGQRVVAAALEEDLLGGFQLGVQRVGQRCLVLNGHLGQELACGGNFVAAFRHGNGAQPSALAGDGADQFQMRVAQRFAVHDHQVVLRRDQELFLPGQQRALQGGGVHADEYVAEGRDARTAEAAGVFVAAKAQRAQLALGQRGGVVGQILRPAPHSAESGLGDEGQHSGDGEDQPFFGAAFGHFSPQRFDQAAQLRGFGRATGPGVLFHHGPVGRERGRTQFHTGFFDQFAHPDLFGTVVLLIEVLGAAFPTSTVAQFAPAADLVGGAAVELRVHETLDQRQRMTPARLPVGGEACEHEFHETADEIGVMAVRQHQQAGVVGQQGQARAPLFVGPTDEGVARLEMPGGRAPGGQRQPVALVSGDIAMMFADQFAAFKIMVLDDELVETLGFVRLDGPDGQMIEDVLLVHRRLAVARSVDFVLHQDGSVKTVARNVPQNLSTSPASET